MEYNAGALVGHPCSVYFILYFNNIDFMLCILFIGKMELETFLAQELLPPGFDYDIVYTKVMNEKRAANERVKKRMNAFEYK